MDPKNISILVPAYKPNPKLLTDLLQSIRKSNKSHPEIIIGLQGDSNDIASICEIFDAQIVKFDKPSSYRTRVALIDFALNDYVWFVDADDLLLPGAVDTLIRLINENPTIDCHVFNYLASYSVDNLQPVIGGNSKLIDRNEALALFSQNKYIGNAVWQKCFKKSIKASFPDVDLFLGEDAIMTYSVLSASSKVMLLDKPLYFYRLNHSSGSSVLRPSHLRDLLISIKTLSDFHDERIQGKISWLLSDFSEFLWGLFVFGGLNMRDLKRLGKTEEFRNIVLIINSTGLACLRLRKKSKRFVLSCLLKRRFLLLVFLSKFTKFLLSCKSRKPREHSDGAVHQWPE